jgi:pyridoxine kinase
MNKKVITIQDISCFGQCSITVALPILSAAGIETAIIPSAVLSTHTYNFKGFTFNDLSNDIPNILDHHKKEGLKFDAVYSGYLGSVDIMPMVLRMVKDELLPNGIFVLDPVMGDNGHLYPIFNDEYVQGMKTLVAKADILLPNITEASFLTGVEYKEKYDKEYIMSLLKGLKELGAKTIVLTGVSYKEGMTGVVVYDGNYQYYEHEKINKSYHGTGDVYASSFLGAYLQNGDIFESAKIAAHFVVKCIKNTINDDSHWYGVKFEPLLGEYALSLKK